MEKFLSPPPRTQSLHDAELAAACLRVLRACGRLAVVHYPYEWRCGMCGMPQEFREKADACCADLKKGH